MKMWKVDTGKWTVRQVEGEPWPGKDNEGECCFENTHFDNASDAWRKLDSESVAYCECVGWRVKNCKEALQRAETEAGLAVVALALAQQNHKTANASALAEGTDSQKQVVGTVDQTGKEGKT